MAPLGGGRGSGCCGVEEVAEGCERQRPVLSVSRRMGRVTNSGATMTGDRVDTFRSKKDGGSRPLAGGTSRMARGGRTNTHDACDEKLYGGFVVWKN